MKLAFYLTDVRTGAFNFIKGSHQQQHPRLVKNHEVKDFEASRFVELTGPAGTAFLFDTSGIHRQGVPMLEPRQAVFLQLSRSASSLAGGGCELLSLSSAAA